MDLSTVLEAAIRKDLSTKDLIALLREHESHSARGYYCELRTTVYDQLYMSNVKSKHKEPELWEPWSPYAIPANNYQELTLLQSLDDGTLNWTMDLLSDCRNQFLRSLCDPSRNGNLLLVWNPYEMYGDDEPVFLQSMKRICGDLRQLGAVAQINDFDIYGPLRSAKFVGRLCEQLCIRCPPYRRALREVLINHPTIFYESGLSYLVQKLISETFKKLRISHSDYFTKPLTIFIDWWKETDLSTLVGLLSSIAEDQHSKIHPCLLWVVSCPWNPLISTLLSQDSFQIRQIKLVDSDDTIHYSEAILHLRFQEIRARHCEMFGEDEEWPLKDDLKQLARAVSGAEPLINLITRFVDLAGNEGPRVRLQKCLAYMCNAPALTIQSPYDAPTHFFNQFINNTPEQLHCQVLQVLGCLGYYPSIDAPTLPRLIHILGIDPALRSQIVAHLDWILADLEDTRLDDYSHKPEYSLSKAVRYLGHIRFHPIVVEEQYLALIKSYLFFFSRSPLLSSKPQLHVGSGSVVDDPLTAATRCVGHLYEDFSKFLRICHHTATMDQGRTVIALLKDFDFRRLAFVRNRTCSSDLLQLSRWLHQSAHGKGIVRTTASDTSDRLFIDQCNGVAEPLDFSSIDSGFSECPKFILLGHGANTILSNQESSIYIYA
ncbi:hypothetical protein NP233_g153 [Leucocoprinus birnbaumii]|uniref:Uncharacterized protein n=1 Tax=Leucocoprinus birnbaumii TaxID=56174 RepID=A0AAD5W745_9AGAR|nr:hypothetical protein NP233_g153 [Leucocoprinus birnbaumii]